jgi:protein-tyrosine phosphatase
MAEAIFLQRVSGAGLSDQIGVASSGTGAWHVGEPAHSGTQVVLRKHGIHFQGAAQQFEYTDLDTCDYVLAMDRENLRTIMRAVNRGDWRAPSQEDRLPGSAGKAEVALFLSYANRAGIATETEVPDPYYNGRFDRVYDLVSRGCDALLDHIRQTHHL